MFFETKGVSASSAKTEPFEFVLIDSPSLFSFGKRGADRHSFQEHFRRKGDINGVAFHNLRRDAKLVAPKPITRDFGHYAHLGAFVRGAPCDQTLEVFRMVAVEYLSILLSSPRPVWLSTSGLGVAWLHFRLDSTPKYYQYGPFRMRSKTSATSGSTGARRFM